MVSFRLSVRAIHAQPHLSVHMHLKHGRLAETDSANGPNAPFASQSREIRRTLSIKRHTLPSSLAGLSSSGSVMNTLPSCDALISERRLMLSSSVSMTSPASSMPQSTYPSIGGKVVSFCSCTNVRSEGEGEGEGEGEIAQSAAVLDSNSASLSMERDQG